MNDIHEHIPSDCKGEKPTLEGRILLRCPSVHEALEVFSEMNLKLNEDGEVDSNPMSQLGAISKVAKRAESFVHKVELKILEDGTKIETFKEFSIYPECRNAFIELATKIINGYRPTKNLKP